MSRMGFQKKKMDRGVGGWVELYPNFLGFLEFFKLCKAPKQLSGILAYRSVCRCCIWGIVVCAMSLACCSIRMQV